RKKYRELHELSLLSPTVFLKEHRTILPVGNARYIGTNNCDTKKLMENIHQGKLQTKKLRLRVTFGDTTTTTTTTTS
ncbi:hypothetical protein V1477_008428, partial [Vespula maculifrons]